MVSFKSTISEFVFSLKYEDAHIELNILCVYIFPYLCCQRHAARVSLLVGLALGNVSEAFFCASSSGPVTFCYLLLALERPTLFNQPVLMDIYIVFNF